jgi:ribosomal protein S18 acetylase RimI-like enzyme
MALRAPFPSLRRSVHGSADGARVRELAARDASEVARLLAWDPAANAYLRSELRDGLRAGEWWGVEDGDGLRAVVSGRALLVPWIPREQDARLLAVELAGPQVRMLVGPRPSVLALHAALGRLAREVREPQLLLGVGAGTLAATAEAPLRRATRADLNELVVAAAHMHREEMGVDPLLVDANGWRARMLQLVDRGWSWVWRHNGRILFKAELSAWTPEAVQIQGVYTAPVARGRGVATRALASMCAALLRETALCTLYVNHYNSVALSVYRRVGFHSLSRFATVIY